MTECVLHGKYSEDTCAEECDRLTRLWSPGDHATCLDEHAPCRACETSAGWGWVGASVCPHLSFMPGMSPDQWHCTACGAQTTNPTADELRGESA